MQTPRVDSQIVRALPEPIARKSRLPECRLPEWTPNLNLIPILSRSQYHAILNPISSRSQSHHNLNLIPIKSCKSVFLKSGCKFELHRYISYIQFTYQPGKLLGLNSILPGSIYSTGIANEPSEPGSKSRPETYTKLDLFARHRK